MSRRLSDYRFTLDESLIATRPLEDRSSSRLLVLKADAERPEHRVFTDVKALLRPGDRLVINDTKVIPARLHAEKAVTGGHVEVLLCRAEESGTMVALVKASKKVRSGTRLVFDAGQSSPEPFFAEVIEALADEPGAYRLRFEGDAVRYAEHFGHVPLPPYMQRDDDDHDLDRYQTVYADDDKPGSAAAPTAGFHFTPTLMTELMDQGVDITRVTLHVGPGTFLPVRTDNLDDHQMHAEPWELSVVAAAAINATREAGGRIIAVGTTSVRTLESAADNEGRVEAGRGLTRLFITPGYRFKVVEGLITNFHLPESTLLMLVSAFAGRERVLAAYEEAVREGYRFYSYGDACFFERQDALA